MTTETSMNIAPLTPPYADEVAAELSKLMGGTNREPLNLFRTMARNLPLTKAWGALGAHNLTRGALSVRDRELLILRTCYLGNCEYEWGVHARIYARAAGLTETQYLATAHKDIETGTQWSGHDIDVLRFADELHETSRGSAELLARLRTAWDDAQLLEACEVAGFYHGVAYMANVADVELEQWGVRFPR